MAGVEFRGAAIGGRAGPSLVSISDSNFSVSLCCHIIIIIIMDCGGGGESLFSSVRFGSVRSLMRRVGLVSCESQLEDGPIEGRSQFRRSD